MLIRIRIYLFLALALVSTIPIVFFGVWPQSKALENEIAEVSERHLLIAKNIRHALQRYDRDLRGLFRLLASQAIAGTEATDAEQKRILENFQFRHICIARIDDPTVIHEALARESPCPTAIPTERFALFANHVMTDKVSYTPVQAGPDGQPILYLVTRFGDLLAVGAINTDYFVALGKAIAFDKGGHAAIVDKIGQVLAHPLPEWIEARKNISKVEPVKLMLAGKTGVSQFFSPAAKKDMIAGYTVVPGPGWGVMIPQPMSELEAKASEAKFFALGVILFGLALAGLTAWWLAGATARPVTSVVQAAQAMAQGKRGVRVAEFSGITPMEISELARSFNEMSEAVERAMDAEQETYSDFRAIFGASPAATFLLDGEQRFRLVSRQFEIWFGRSEAEVKGQTPEQVFPFTVATHLKGAFQSALDSEVPIDIEFSAEFSDGEAREMTAHVFPIFNANAELNGVGVILVDSTAQKIAEESLRQAQKMESVGQLTGGVAHDFNNLLATIIGNTELLGDRFGIEDESIQAILRSAARGSELTQRLLAFSRQQPLRPVAIDLEALLLGMSKLLKRTLGATVEIQTKVAPDAWNVLADPGQVEAALLNLALNARDAMPGGGTLTIECTNARLDEDLALPNSELLAGDYVVLAVRDTGFGMSEDAIAHAFEPFFTTKEVGQGSGLGLSMVYGFAKQSGGHAVIQSDGTAGTTVRLYLPRTAELPAEEAAADGEDPAGRGERVLVLEDDPDVRALAVIMLEGLGYRVLDAATTVAAREVLKDGGRVDIVLADVVLPGGMSGPEFVEEVLAENPDLKAIFMSGYSEVAAKNTGILSSDKVLLNKPFRRSDLATAMRDVLDGGTQTA